MARNLIWMIEHRHLYRHVVNIELDVAGSKQGKGRKQSISNTMCRFTRQSSQTLLSLR